MLKNDLKIALRNLYKHKTVSLINIIGLAVGMAACILIAAYVLYEFSYDGFHENRHRIYRLISIQKRADQLSYKTHTHSALGLVLQKEFPDIESGIHVMKQNVQIKYKQHLIKIDALRSESDIFKIFSFPLLRGHKTSVLDGIHSIVISEKLARTYFAGKDPVGSLLTVTGYYGKPTSYTVSGVMKDIPSNSYFKADAIMAIDKKNDIDAELNWHIITSVQQYLLLNKDVKADELAGKFKSIYKKYAFPENLDLDLQSLSDIHLYSEYEDEISPTSDIKYIYIFLSAALLILIIASINFINLTTAYSLRRAKEVGVRKVLGAFQSQLVIQFLAESLLLYTISLLLGVIIVAGMLPWFSETLGMDLQVNVFFNPWLTLGVLVLIVVVGLLSAAYPSFYLSSQNPVFVLKGVLKTSMLSTLMRQSLVVVQFTIGSILIIATLVVYSQMNYISTRRLGFDTEQLLILPQRIHSKTQVFKEQLLTHHGIAEVSFGSWNPGQHYGASSSMNNPVDSTKLVKFDFVDADFDFITTLGIALKEGRHFSTTYSADNSNYTDSLLNHKMEHEQFVQILSERSIILNETALQELGLKQPVGQIIKLGALQGTVIGVVKDFNGMSLHQKVTPVVIRAYQQTGGLTFIRIRADNVKETLAFIEKQWKTFYPERTYEFSFVDEHLQRLYYKEIRTQSVFTAFTFVAIGIAGMGLLGLALFTAQHRSKEIGIRKVLGASVTNIVTLLSKDFLKLICIALLIASPIAWYLMSKWLEDFAYRIQMGWWMFAVSGVTVLLLALLTLIYHSIRAAITNPSDSLRME